MSDGGQERASLAVEVWKSSQQWSARQSAVRSIAWLDVNGSNKAFGANIIFACCCKPQRWCTDHAAVSGPTHPLALLRRTLLPVDFVYKRFA
jgi:hypothetical protein